MKKLIISLALLLPLSCLAQSYVEQIEQIAARSLAIKSYRAKFTADSLAQRRGLNPSDPEVSIDYFLDNNFELKIEQQIDFPTLYIQRGKLSKLNIERASIEFRMSHRDLMLSISEQYITLIYQQNLYDLLLERSARLKEYVAKIERGVELGEKLKLDLVAAQTLEQETQGELAMAKSTLEQCRTTLGQWDYNAQTPSTYPMLPTISRAAFLSQATNADLATQIAQADSIIAERSLKVSRNEWIPKITVGYRMDLDHEQGSTRSAIAAGLSIPLWQNRGNIKHSKAMIKSAQAQKAAVEKSVVSTLNNIYSMYEATENSLKLFPRNDDQYLELLDTSLKSGAITQTDFLLSVIERYTLQQRRIELEMQNALNRTTIELLLN